MKASPLKNLTARFGDANETNKTEARKAAKEALIKELRALVKKGDLLEEDFSEKGLERVSNRKLLKLLDLSKSVQEEFGTRTGLIDRLIDIEKRTKDAGYREHLERFSLPTLFSRYQASKKRQG
jgi:hypothetical protein